LLDLSFFVLYAWLPLNTQGSGIMQFNSPDETGNFLWTERMAESKPLYVIEPLENPGNNLIRLRGMNVADGKLVPGSFLGLNFIYGTIAKVFGRADIIPYLTPLFAVVGVFFFYLLISQIFKKDIAFLASMLSFSVPALAYFANRSMYHNVLFVALLIIGLYFLVRVLLNASSRAKPRDLTTQNLHNDETLRPASPELQRGEQAQGDKWKKIRWLDLLHYSLAGAFVGLALITRTSELGWVSLTLLLIFIFNFKKINWAGFILFSGLVVFSFVPVFYTNLILYNAPLSIGYDTGLSGEFGTIFTQVPLIIRLLVSPFGLHPVSIVINGFNYLVQFFWYLTAPAFFGFIFWVFSNPDKSHPEQSEGTPTNVGSSPDKLGDSSVSLRMTNVKKRQWAFFTIFLVITLYLSMFYGSWQIADRIDNSTFSIGTSYVRYFLPIYLMMTVFVAFLIDQFLKLFKYEWAKSIVGGLVLLFFAIPSFLIVGWTEDESLLALKETLAIQNKKAQIVQEIVPPEAVVVSGFKQADKIFFPERKIIPELAVDFDYESIAILGKIVPLYYYHFAPTSTVDYISRRDFEPFGLKMGEGTRVFGNEFIYPVGVLGNE